MLHFTPNNLPLSLNGEYEDFVLFCLVLSKCCMRVLKKFKYDINLIYLYHNSLI